MLNYGILQKDLGKEKDLECVSRSLVLVYTTIGLTGATGIEPVILLVLPQQTMVPVNWKT